MATDINSNEKEQRKRRTTHGGGNSDAIYGFGVIGAWVYFLSKATTVWMGVIGIVKGVFWPGFLVFELLKYLKM